MLGKKPATTPPLNTSLKNILSTLQIIWDETKVPLSKYINKKTQAVDRNMSYLEYCITNSVNSSPCSPTTRSFTRRLEILPPTYILKQTQSIIKWLMKQRQTNSSKGISEHSLNLPPCIMVTQTWNTRGWVRGWERVRKNKLINSFSTRLKLIWWYWRREWSPPMKCTSSTATTWLKIE